MATRRIDRHEVRQRPYPSPTTDTRHFTSLTKINQWRNAWTACYKIVQDWPHVDYTRFHDVFQYWVPIINWIFESPINLHRYQATFQYCNETPGPKEIIQIYMGEMRTSDEKIPTFIIFNVYEFRKILTQYCADMARTNRLMVDEARGTINTLALDDAEMVLDPAEFFKTMTAWELLFIFTLHALAHWDTFDKYDHCHYDTHQYVRDSVFFKMSFYGQIVLHRYREDE